MPHKPIAFRLAAGLTIAVPRAASAGGTGETVDMNTISIPHPAGTEDTYTGNDFRKLREPCLALARRALPILREKASDNDRERISGVFVYVALPRGQRAPAGWPAAEHQHNFTLADLGVNDAAAA